MDLLLDDSNGLYSGNKNSDRTIIKFFDYNCSYCRKDHKDIDKIIENNPDQVEALAEKPNLIGWFVGQTMKETQGKANPKTVNEILRKKLLNKG